ncbi:MAG: hypothetical protein WB421_09090 [Terriglobales bacterium]
MERTISWPRIIAIITAGIIITTIGRGHNFWTLQGGPPSPAYSHLRFFVPAIRWLKMR